MEEHETENVIIVKAKVDKRMVPIVKWFNNQPGVQTLWCCQGDNIQGPNIVFICTNLIRLMFIHQKSTGYVKTIEVFPINGMMRYNMLFSNITDVESMMRVVSKLTQEEM